MHRGLAAALLLFCVLLNALGFVFKLFEPVPLYDEVAHFVTPFVLVALASEALYRLGGHDQFFRSPPQAALTGAVIGLVGAVGWEVIEVWLANAGFSISNRAPDTFFDVVLGVAGGALGGFYADRYLDNLFGSPRRTRPRVR